MLRTRQGAWSRLTRRADAARHAVLRPWSRLRVHTIERGQWVGLVAGLRLHVRYFLVLFFGIWSNGSIALSFSESSMLTQG